MATVLLKVHREEKVMQLHTACRERLIECVAKGLQEVRFQNRYFLDYSSFGSLDSCSLALPRSIQELASTWISPDHPLRDFSYGFVGENRNVYAERLNELSNGDFPVLLSEITDTSQMTIQIVDSFTTLPWEYTVVLPFVSTAGSDFRLKQLPLSGDLVIKQRSELRFPFPKRTDLLGLAGLSEAASDWSSDRLYLEATVQGYIGSWPDTETLERFYNQVRTVAGVGLAINAFKRSVSPPPTFLLLDPAFSFKPLYVFRTDQGGEAKEKTKSIPERLGPLDQLELSPTSSDSIILLPIAFGDDDECSKLREAGQWYFASETERDEIFKFVEAVVVLEILFNDKATADEVGIEKLIANRCAYLVASSTTEREDIIKDFKSIYAARSHIVHKGKARLTKADRALLIKARVLGSCSILKELGMIFRSQRKKADSAEGRPS